VYFDGAEKNFYHTDFIVGGLDARAPLILYLPQINRLSYSSAIDRATLAPFSINV